MPSRRVLKSVLAGLLGTLVSRYSDFEGYWALGRAESCLDGWTVDLLGTDPEPGDDPASSYLRRLARARFSQQLEKAGLSLAVVADAQATVASVGEQYRALPGMYPRIGRDYTFAATVRTDTGRVFEAKRMVFVAPHDAQLEIRRNPEQWGT